MKKIIGNIVVYVVAYLAAVMMMIFVISVNAGLFVRDHLSSLFSRSAQ